MANGLGTERGLPFIEVKITPLQLSDLFFNHEHLQFNTAIQHYNARSAEAQTALQRDAEEFTFHLLGTVDTQLAKALVDDFLGRL